MEPLLVNVEETRAACGHKGRDWVYQRIASGDFRSIKLGARRLIFFDSVRAYLARILAEQSGGSVSSD